MLRPAAALVERADAAASGELICVAPGVELHIYLDVGRVAWSTTSRDPHAFASWLQDAAGVDTETLAQVVDECRRSRLPLRETLVEWGLTTWDELRGALSRQIAAVLAELASFDTAEVVFLHRRYGGVDPRLTFEVRDLLPDVGACAPRASASMPVGSIAQPGLAQHLRATVAGLEWVEVLDSEQVVDAAPPGTSRTSVDWLHGTLLDGADFVALRSASRSVIGLSLSPQRTLWCAGGPDASFGGVVAATGVFAGDAERGVSNGGLASSAAWCVGDDRAPCSAPLHALLHEEPAVLGALILSEGDADDVFAGCGRGALALDDCVGTARRRKRTLGDRARGDGSRTMMASREPTHWCFGAELGGERATLWLFVERTCAQGLGWAYLGAAVRMLTDPPRAP